MVTLPRFGRYDHRVLDFFPSNSGAPFPPPASVLLPESFSFLLAARHATSCGGRPAASTVRNSSICRCCQEEAKVSEGIRLA